MCRFAPEVSHLLFVDDCLLFCKSTTVEYSQLKNVLDDYELALGEAINYVKSGIFFQQEREF